MPFTIAIARFFFHDFCLSFVRAIVLFIVSDFYSKYKLLVAINEPMKNYQHNANIQAKDWIEKENNKV